MKQTGSTSWTKVHPETGQTLNAVLPEAEPGIYLIDADLMHELLIDNGWTQQP